MANNLTPKQRRALEALLTTWSVSDAAERAGVSRDTMYRWMRQPAFRAALDDSIKESIAALSRKLVTLSDYAVNTLAMALTNSAPVALQVRAADIVLGRLLALRQLHDLEERVAALEKAVKDEHI